MAACQHDYKKHWTIKMRLILGNTVQGTMPLLLAMQVSVVA